MCGERDQLQRAGSGYTTLCATCFTFGGTYRSIKRPGRMGAGWLGLVTPERAHLVTSVAYPPDQTPFAAVDNLAIATGKEALSPFLRDILLAPPDPPYLLFASGNSSVKVMRGLAVTRSNRRVHISGNDPAIVDDCAQGPFSRLEKKWGQRFDAEKGSAATRRRPVCL